MSADNQVWAGPGPDATYNSYIEKGEFRLQRSKATGKYVFPPRVMAPGSMDNDFTWEKASGNGTVYSAVIVRQRPEAGGDFSIVLVDLEEGVRMMSRVVGTDPAAVKIGQRVKAKIGEIDGKKLVIFEAA